MSAFKNLKTSVMRKSRERKLDHFYSTFSEGQSVLDVGVSSESTAGMPTRNYFLKNYKYDSSTYTALGVQDLSEMSSIFPGKKFVTYNGVRFPFSDKSFDWVFSNAVIEHVGDDDRQVDFINEMLRVAHNVFFTTPNKYFPIEAHTNILFLHWNNRLFYKWCRPTRPWVSKNTLYLLSKRRLENLISKSNIKEYEVTSNRVLGLPMTFTVLCSDSTVSNT